MWAFGARSPAEFAAALKKYTRRGGEADHVPDLGDRERGRRVLQGSGEGDVRPVALAEGARPVHGLRGRPGPLPDGRPRDLEGEDLQLARSDAGDDEGRETLTMGRAAAQASRPRVQPFADACRTISPSCASPQ